MAWRPSRWTPEHELCAQARRSFRRLGRRPSTLAAFIRHAGLRITGPP